MAQYRSVYDAVVAIIEETLGIDEGVITRESHLFNDLGADSIQAVELRVKFEEVFDLALDWEMAELLIVGDIVDFLEAEGATVSNINGSGSSSGSGSSGSGSSSRSGSGSSDTSNLTFIQSLLTSSPYPNSKKFIVEIIPIAYIYTDDNCYKPSEDRIFLYCSENDDRDPEGKTTLAIYYTDPDEEYENEEDYVEWANDHPAFYRGQDEYDGMLLDMWDMYELNGSGEGSIIMTFLTQIVVDNNISQNRPRTIDLSQYCPIYEDLLNSVFQNSRFPNTSFSNTQSQILGTNSVPSRTPYMLNTPGYIDGLNLDLMVFVQGKYISNPTSSLPASSFTWNGTNWSGKNILFHPGYINNTYEMHVDPSIFTTWLIQTSSISSGISANCYFPIVNIDAIEENPLHDHGVVTVLRPPVFIPLHTPTCIFWGKIRHQGVNFIVPFAVVTWTSNGTSVSSRHLFDWKSLLPI